MQNHSVIDIIGIPHGTRLTNLVLYDDEVHIWIACKNMQGKYESWQGTYLRVCSDGFVERVTIDHSLVEPEQRMVIKRGKIEPKD